VSRRLDVRSALGATFDVAAAVLSVAFLAGLPASIVHDAFGAPLPSGVLGAGLAAVAVVGAYPFVAGDWSLARLTDFALAAFLALVAVGGAAALVLTAVGGVETDSAVGSALTIVVTLVAYLVGAGYVLSRQRRHDAARGAADEWL
jgi:uncharacterized membrane protein AbrB (regulator of aidB expression)